MSSDFEWETDDSATKISNDGKTFSNSEAPTKIIFASARSKKEFTSGEHSCVIHVDKAKEYAGKSTNTFIGIIQSGEISAELSLSGDGVVHLDEDDHEAEVKGVSFKTGSDVYMTLNMDKKLLSWRVGPSGKVVTANIRPQINSVAFFGQVIQGGDGLSFGPSPAKLTHTTPVKPDKSDSDESQSESDSPITSLSAGSDDEEELLTWEAADKNAEVVGNNTVFTNSAASEISWAKAKSSKTFSSGVNNCIVHTTKTKEYGGSSSNTYIGVIQGNETVHITGDGKVHIGSKSFSASSVKFGSEKDIYMTLDMDKKTLSWRVGSGGTVVTADLPSAFRSPAFFAQVIRSGDSCSFKGGAVKLAPASPVNAGSGGAGGSDESDSLSLSLSLSDSDSDDSLDLGLGSSSSGGLTWEAADKNAKTSGASFTNAASSSIAWAKAKSSKTFSSGVNNCIVHTTKTKEYGGSSSNTYIGVIQGNETVHITGDGKVHIGSKSFSASSVKFGSEKDIYMTLDMDKKTLSWRVGSGGTVVTAHLPSAFRSPAFFAQVIQSGDSCSFKGGAVKLAPASSPFGASATAAPPKPAGPVQKSNPSELKWTAVGSNVEVAEDKRSYRNSGGSICWAKAKSEQKFSSGVHNACIFTEQAKQYGATSSNTYIGIIEDDKTTVHLTGAGKISVGGETVDASAAKFGQQQSVYMTLDMQERKLSFQVEKGSVVTVNLPNTILSPSFFGQVIQGGDTLVFKDQAPELKATAPLNKAAEPAASSESGAGPESDAYCWESMDRNATVIDNGATFKNTGSEICWAKAKTKSALTSGTRSAFIKIDRAKEYGNKSSNTYVGVINSKGDMVYISGDGNVHAKGSTPNTDAVFKTGDKILVTIDLNAKTVTWKVNNNKQVSGALDGWSNAAFFAQVIRGGSDGDRISIESSSQSLKAESSGIVKIQGESKAKSTTDWHFEAGDRNTEVFSNGKAFRNTGDDICWSKGKTKESFSSGKHTAILKIDKAKEYGGQCSNTYIGVMNSKGETVHITGSGGVHGTGSKATEPDASFCSGDTVVVTFDLDAHKITWKVNNKGTVSAKLPSWSDVRVFAQVIRGGDHISIISDAPSAPATGGTGSTWSFKATDSNTEVIQGGKGFRNTGGSICWSKGRSAQEYSTGAHTARFKIVKAKQYGEFCSNTYVGIIQGSQTAYISGDGGVHIGGSDKNERNCSFGEGDVVTVKFDCHAKLVTWQVNSKAEHTDTLPSSWTGSIGVFAQVIRNGDTIEFDESSVNLLAQSTAVAKSITPVAPEEEGDPVKSSTGAELVCSGRPWITTQDFGQITVFNVPESTKKDTDTKWRGYGYMLNPETGKRMAVYCIHYFNNANMCFVQTLEVPWNHKRDDTASHLDDFEKVFPSGSKVEFYSIITVSYERIPPKTKPKYLIEGSDFGKNGEEIVSASGAQIVVSGDPFISNQKAGGQVLVFNVNKTATDTQTKWKGFGYIENASSKEKERARMPIWAIHYLNNAGLCFVQTLPVPFDQKRDVLDRNLKEFKEKFPKNSKLKFYSLEKVDYTPEGDRKAFKPKKNWDHLFKHSTVASSTPEKKPLPKGLTPIESKTGAKIVVSSTPWITTQDFGQVTVFNVVKTVSDTETKWRGTGRMKNVATGESLPIYAIHYFNNSQMCFVQTFEDPFDHTKEEIKKHMDQFTKKFPSGAEVQFFSSNTIPFTRVPPSTNTVVVDINPAPPPQSVKGEEIKPKSDCTIIVDSKPWITTQEFGQIVVFNVKKTGKDTSTTWRGFGYIENTSTKERMCLWCIHYFNNANMCFIQTLEVPWGVPKEDLDEHTKIFSKKFPKGSELKFYSIKKGEYVRVPSKKKPEITMDAPSKLKDSGMQENETKEVLAEGSAEPTGDKKKDLMQAEEDFVFENNVCIGDHITLKFPEHDQAILQSDPTTDTAGNSSTFARIAKSNATPIRAIFRIDPKLYYSAKENFESWNRIQGSAAEANSQTRKYQEKYNREAQTNKEKKISLHNKPIFFGQTVQLFHTATGKYLTADSHKPAKKDASSLALDLSAEESKNCWFKLLPAFKIRKLGEQIRPDDQIIISHIPTSAGLQVGQALDEKKKEDNQTARKFETNLTKGEFSTCILHLEFRTAIDPSKVKGGDVVRIRHGQLGGASLKTDLSRPYHLADNYITPDDSEWEDRQDFEVSFGGQVYLSTYRRTCKELWEIQLVNQKNSGQSSLKWGESLFYLKSVTAERYLCLSASGDKLFFSRSKDQAGKFYFEPLDRPASPYVDYRSFLRIASHSLGAIPHYLQSGPRASDSIQEKHNIFPKRVRYTTVHSDQRKYQEVVYLETVELDEVSVVEQALKWGHKIEKLSTVSEKKEDNKQDKVAKATMNEGKKKTARRLTTTEITALLEINEKIRHAMKNPHTTGVLSDLKLQDYIARILVHPFNLQAKDWAASSNGGDDASKKFNEKINSDENAGLRKLFVEYYEFLLMLTQAGSHTSWYLIDFLQVFLQQIPANIGARALVQALLTHTRSFVEKLSYTVRLDVFLDLLTEDENKFTDSGTMNLLSTLCTYQGVPIPRNQKLILKGNKESGEGIGREHFIPVVYENKEPKVKWQGKELNFNEFFELCNTAQAKRHNESQMLKDNSNKYRAAQLMFLDDLKETNAVEMEDMTPSKKSTEEPNLNTSTKPEEAKKPAVPPSVSTVTLRINESNAQAELEQLGAKKLKDLDFRSKKSENLSISDKNAIVRTSQTSKLWAIARDLNGIPATEDYVFWSIWIDTIDEEDKNNWKICIGVTSEMDPDLANGSSWNGGKSEAWGLQLGKCQLVKGSPTKATDSDSDFKLSEGVEVILLVNRRKRTMEFFWNGTKCKVKHKDLHESEVLYPFVSVSGFHSVIINKAATPSTPSLSRQGSIALERRDTNSHPVARLRWDPEFTSKTLKALKGKHLERNTKTQSKEKWGLTRANKSFSTGVHTWLIRVTDVSEDDTNTWKICVGVCDRLVDPNTSTGGAWNGGKGKAWGIQLGGCQLVKGSPTEKGATDPLGLKLPTGKQQLDIEVELECEKKELRFKWNGKTLSIFHTLEGKEWWPFASMSGDHALTLFTSTEEAEKEGEKEESATSMMDDTTTDITDTTYSESDEFSDFEDDIEDEEDQLGTQTKENQELDEKNRTEQRERQQQLQQAPAIYFEASLRLIEAVSQGNERFMKRIVAISRNRRTIDDFMQTEVLQYVLPTGSNNEQYIPPGVRSAYTDLLRLHLEQSLPNSDNRVQHLWNGENLDYFGRKRVSSVTEDVTGESTEEFLESWWWTTDMREQFISKLVDAVSSKKAFRNYGDQWGASLLLLLDKMIRCELIHPSSESNIIQKVIKSLVKLLTEELPSTQNKQAYDRACHVRLVILGILDFLNTRHMNELIEEELNKFVLSSLNYRTGLGLRDAFDVIRKRKNKAKVSSPNFILYPFETISKLKRRLVEFTSASHIQLREKSLQLLFKVARPHQRLVSSLRKTTLLLLPSHCELFSKVMSHKSRIEHLISDNDISKEDTSILMNIMKDLICMCVVDRNPEKNDSGAQFIFYKTKFHETIFELLKLDRRHGSMPLFKVAYWFLRQMCLNYKKNQDALFPFLEYMLDDMRKGVGSSLVIQFMLQNNVELIERIKLDHVKQIIERMEETRNYRYVNLLDALIKYKDEENKVQYIASSQNMVVDSIFQARSTLWNYNKHEGCPPANALLPFHLEYSIDRMEDMIHKQFPPPKAKKKIMKRTKSTFGKSDRESDFSSLSSDESSSSEEENEEQKRGFRLVKSRAKEPADDEWIHPVLGDLEGNLEVFFYTRMIELLTEACRSNPSQILRLRDLISLEQCTERIGSDKICARMRIAYFRFAEVIWIKSTLVDPLIEAQLGNSNLWENLLQQIKEYHDQLSFDTKDEEINELILRRYEQNRDVIFNGMIPFFISYLDKFGDPLAGIEGSDPVAVQLPNLLAPIAQKGKADRKSIMSVLKYLQDLWDDIAFEEMKKKFLAWTEPPQTPRDDVGEEPKEDDYEEHQEDPIVRILFEHFSELTQDYQDKIEEEFQDIVDDFRVDLSEEGGTPKITNLVQQLTTDKSPEQQFLTKNCLRLLAKMVENIIEKEEGPNEFSIQGLKDKYKGKLEPLEQIQKIMEKADALQIAIDLLGSNNKTVIEYVGRFGRDVLAGGSAQFQTKMIQFFQSGESHFFPDMVRLLSNYTKQFSSLSVTVPRRGDYIIPILQLLQNLCESHNTEMKNLMREQLTRGTSVKESASQSLIKYVVDLAEKNAEKLLSLLETVSFHGETEGILEQIEESIKLATQCWATLTEFSTGCEQNQIALTHSQILIPAATLLSEELNQHEDSRKKGIARRYRGSILKMRIALIEFVLSLTEGLSVRASDLPEHMKSLPPTLLINTPWSDLQTVMKIYLRDIQQNKRRKERRQLEKFMSSSLILMKVLSPFASENLRESIFLHTKEPFSSFAQRHTASIEVVTDQRLQRVHFQLPKSCLVKPDEDTKIKTLNKLNRDTPAEKITDYFKSIDALEIETQHRAKLRHSWWIIQLVTNHPKLYKFIISFLALVINILLIVSLTASEFDTGEVFAPASIEFVIIVLGIIHFTFTTLFLISYLTERIPIKLETRRIKRARERKIKSTDKKLNPDDADFEKFDTDLTIHNDHDDPLGQLGVPFGKWSDKVVDVASDYLDVFFDIFNFETAWYIIYWMASIIATAVVPPLFALHILDISIQDSRVRTVLRAVTQNGKALLLTALLGVIVVYQFSMISFFFLRDNYTNELPCETLAQCLLTTFSFGIRSGGGIGEVLEPLEFDDPLYGSRFVFDVSFYIVVVVILLGIIFGIILDTFSELRQKRESIERDNTSRCLVCSIPNEEFQAVSGASGFETHIKQDHNIWKYMYFFVYLDTKNPDEYNAVEWKINRLRLQNDPSFFPIHQALVLKNYKRRD